MGEGLQVLVPAMIASAQGETSDPVSYVVPKEGRFPRVISPNVVGHRGDFVGVCLTDVVLHTLDMVLYPFFFRDRTSGLTMSFRGVYLRGNS